MKSYPDFKGRASGCTAPFRGDDLQVLLSRAFHGRGKAVINLPAPFDPHQRPGLLRRYGNLVRQLGGLYYTGRMWVPPLPI